MSTCPTCRSGVIEVPLKVGDEQLTIVRCAQCDTHRWERDGVVVDLEEVIDLTAVVTERQRQERRTSRR